MKVTSFKEAKEHLDEFLNREFIVDRYSFYLKQKTKLTKEEEATLATYERRDIMLSWLRQLEFT